MSKAALLVLADGRFPAGGHAHSGGAEEAVKAGRITDAASLEDFCRGRLHTAGLVAAALAAATAAGADPVELDAAADARTPSPALRVAARRLGRQLMRAARVTWPSAELDALVREFPKGAHQPVVLGLTARAAGLGASDAAYCAAYESVSGSASAVVRLLSLDPFEATGVLARVAPQVDLVVDRAVAAGVRVLGEGVGVLPSASAPLLEIGAEAHAGWGVRLFAS
ncbi:urease accessory protein UreF [Streptomyces galilaeus]|uniref:Urease accessory protein UreF n=1 Tax=Streptomyces bobili TaxID=67280 RepID=A0ABZ1R9H6_9ACTN|nr:MULTISPECIES: urease accessory UreF family protein [Streptomyces]QEU64605.1 urease accessory protein UreF [Streptomyces galilaeus]GGW57946.1 urease accessory protein UreF [Streptomyces galilaeus]